MRALFVIFLLSFFTVLQAETVEECIYQGESFGDGKSNKLVSDTCVNLFFNKANLHAKKIITDKDIKSFGYKNILFTEVGASSGLKKYQSPAHFKTLLITGSNPGFEEVISIDINLENRTIVALVKTKANHEEAILTFELLVSGNILPLRRIQSKELKGASSLKIDTANEKIYVLFNDSSEVKSFDLMDNTHAKDGHNYGKVQKIWNSSNSGLGSAQDLAIVPESEYIYVLDAVSKKVIKLAKNTVGAKGESDIYSDTKHYREIYYDLKSKKLIVLDDKGLPTSLTP